VQAQAKRLNARFEPFEKTGLEDPDKPFFPALLKLVFFFISDGRFLLVGFQLVWRQRE
jgi:hypothetical protein